jgi:hypothetical protein
LSFIGLSGAGIQLKDSAVKIQVSIDKKSKHQSTSIDYVKLFDKVKKYVKCTKTFEDDSDWQG